MTTAFLGKGFLDVEFVKRDHATHHHVVYKRRFDYTNDLTVSYICDIGAVTIVTPRNFPVALDCFRQNTPSFRLRSRYAVECFDATISSLIAITISSGYDAANHK